MAQYEANLRDYWLIVRRRRLIVVASTILVALLAFWLGKNKVSEYQATAAVKFEQSTALSGLLVEVLSYSTADNIETQATLIKSYPILEEVARRMGRLPQTAGTEALRESRAYNATLENLSGKLRTSRVGGTSILEIPATSTNALETRDLANAVAEVYRDYNRNNRNARVIEARKFIENQLREVEARVRRAEEEVWAFRDANRIISPGAESSMLLSVFTQVRGDVEKARQQRIELEQVAGRLERSDPVSVNDRVYIDSQNPAVVHLVATQTDLILERNNLALEVTDRHPRLQAINDDLLTLLKTRHQEALIKESEGVDEVTIVRPATEPTAPTGSEGANMVLLGAALGLMLGLVLAFVQETLDTSIGTIEDVESYLEVPVLGIVPHIDPRETMQRLIERRPALAQIDPDALQSHALLITHFDPKSPVAEAYRTLRTNVQFARLERGGKVLVVTSPTLQEGKTTTIVNLALTMAQSGQKTLLVGANLRRPSIHRFFGIEREPGLSDILVGHVQWRDCIRTVADILMGRFEMEDIMASPGLDNLNIIEAGPIPPNPSELLSSPAMGEFLRSVAEEYDIVLIDTPPTLPVTDSAIVAGQADGVLLVYQAGKVGRLVLKRAKAHLESTRAKVWGVVLNDVQTEVSGYNYTHYYTHYYGEETPSSREGGSLQRAWDRVRSRVGLSRAVAAPSEAAESDTLESAPLAAPDRPASRRRRSPSRTLVLGVGVIGGLAVVLAAVAWQLGVLGPGARPLTPLRERLGIGPASPPPRPVTPPGTPAPPGGSSSVPPAGPSSVVPATSRPSAGSARVETPRAAASPAAPSRSRPAVTSAAPTALAAPPPPAANTPPPAMRFTVEFGPFVTTAEAERVERQLSQAGYPTARFRQPAGAGLYAVLLERVAPGRDAEALAAALREQGFPEASAVRHDPPAVQLGEPLALRGAVDLAERARALGHPVRVAAQPGEAIAHTIRHGNFASRLEAETKADELGRLGLSH